MIYDAVDAKRNGARGKWIPHKGRLPDSLFFRYFTMVDEDVPGRVYNKRENRLDPLFDWICVMIDKIIKRIRKRKERQAWTIQRYQ